MEKLIKLSTIFLICMMTTVTVKAQDITPAKVNYDGELPPMIDRQTFFGDPQYANAKISPDGGYISFLKKYKGMLNVWVKGVDEPFEEAEPVTADTNRPVSSYFWTKDSERILYVQDKGGNENYHIYAVDPDAGEQTEMGVPPAEDLTPYENVQARIYSVPDETPGEIIVGLNDRKAQYHDVYRLDLKTGERTLVYQNESGVAGWQTDLKGNLRLAVRQTNEGGTEILRVEDDTLISVYTCSFEESCSPIRFHKNNEQVYLSTNKGAANLTQLKLFNPKTGETTLVEKDPENEVDFGGAYFSDKTDELLATIYVGDRKRIYPKSEEFKKDYQFLKEQFDGEISFGSSTEDETKQIVTVSSDVDPGSVYLFNREKNELNRLYRSRPDLPSKHLAEMKPIEYEARDGVMIPGYLTLPKGVDAKNLPVIIFPHGGPWSRDSWGYSSYPQFFANRGYAVLQPNFRGSAGYGQEFLNAGNKEWGTGVMQHDVTDGVRYLIEQGIADSTRVGIFGGSYGGYATLAGLTYTPGVYAAGASYVGPSNLITLLNSIPPYWTPIKKMFTKRVGNPDDPEERKRMKEQSPFFHAGQIDDPLLIIQGANDPRVKKQESDQIVVATRDNGIPVEYLVAPEEGHGFSKEDNRLAVAAKLEWFFGEHLGGRYQTGVEEPIKDRLEKLNVDPSTVTLPDTTDSKKGSANAASSGKLARIDGNKIKAAELGYDVTMKAGGQSIDMSINRTISQSESGGQSSWMVVDQTQTPRAKVSDTLFMNRQTLMPIRRHVSGPLTMKVAYGDTGATGEIVARGQSFNIDTGYEPPVFASGSNVRLALAAMSIEDDFSTSMKLFNEQQRKLQTLNLEVTGKEEVKTKGKTAAAYILEMSSDDGSVSGKLYVQQESPHYVLKSEMKQTGPRGSRTVSRELKKIKMK